MSLFEPGFDASAYARSGAKLREIAFPLGGIGTGCVSLDGRGGLIDWEIFGRPNKGCVLEYTFPALYIREQGSEGTREQGGRALRLLGPRLKHWVGESARFWDYGHGRFFGTMDGLPCFDSVTFTGTFPVARLAFEKAGLPVKVELAALNPFIPLDVPASSFPAALLVYRISNLSDRPVSIALAWSLMNPVGIKEQGSQGTKDQGGEEAFVNRGFRVQGAGPPEQGPRFRVQGSGFGVQGIAFSAQHIEPEDASYGEVVLATDWPEVEILESWPVEGWWDSVRTFWSRFRAEGRVEEPGSNGAREQGVGNEEQPSAQPSHTVGTALSPNGRGGPRTPGSVSCRVELAPGESAEIPFVFAWRFPNSEKYWGERESLGREHYATVWPSAKAAARELLVRREELTSRTLAFEEALYDSSLPQPVVESVGNTLSVLHSPTLKRLEDGSFWAWEGCSATAGCCEGTCSHVWNYALAHAYLFPEIQRSFLDTAFNHGFRCGPEAEKGAMIFRVQLPLGVNAKLWHAASDGQLGQIVQIYREWRLTADSDWMRSIYPAAKRALGYAWAHWDRDQDGLAECDMHNTYDINFCSPNPLTQLFYLAALRAMERMGGVADDRSFAAKCGDLATAGAMKTDELWDGEFFRQLGNFEDPKSERYQHGGGCLADQIFGQLSATVAGLGDLIDPERIKSAAEAIYHHNYRSPLGEHENLQRVYAMGDESGLLLCTWPNGEVPAYPFPYSDEVWTGYEYQVASHLAFLGRKDLALDIVTAVRQRHDGERRNPWNEFECGSHYARALSSYGLLLAWTGMRRDGVDGTLTFSEEPFKSFWSVPGAWGTAERTPDGKLDVRVIEGRL